LLDDILGASDNIPPTDGLLTLQPNPVPTTSDIPSIVAYSKNGIEVAFHFVKSNQVGLSQVNAIFRNSNVFTINDFSFMVAVPKYLNLDIQPSSGKQLFGSAQNQQNQKFRLTNHFHGQKPLVIRIQIAYTDGNNNKVVDTAQVANFPPNC